MFLVIFPINLLFVYHLQTRVLYSGVVLSKFLPQESESLSEFPTALHNSLILVRHMISILEKALFIFYLFFSLQFWIF